MAADWVFRNLTEGIGKFIRHVDGKSYFLCKLQMI